MFFLYKNKEIPLNIGRFTKFALVLAIVTLIVGFSGCDQIQQLFIPTPPQMAGLSGEIHIGLSLPLTGRFVATYGYIPMQQGFELALDEINTSLLSDAKITFITKDDRGTVEGAVEAFNKLIHQGGVLAILGPGLSSQAQRSNCDSRCYSKYQKFRYRFRAILV